jgi:cytosine/adenosine deaminase-related metal-dependent hydrolase
MKLRNGSACRVERCRITRVAAFTLFAVYCQIVHGHAKPEAEGPFETLILRNAIIIDGTGAPAKGPVDIVIKHNMIEQILAADPIGRARVGSEPATPANAHVIEAKGMYVTPGLVDMHIHFQNTLPLDYQYKLLLGHGVTTIRFFNIGDDTPQQMVEEKHRSASNQIMAPRMYAYPFWRAYPNDPRFNSAKDAPQIVREWKSLGSTASRWPVFPASTPISSRLWRTKSTSRIWDSPYTLPRKPFIL